jgi:H+-translocating NAD(P) transhydrogenase subunit alpha
MNPTDLANQAQAIADRANDLAMKLYGFHQVVMPVAATAEPFIYFLTIFLLACFVGYYVVWNVTPALHSPLMAVTNGISSVIIVGAMLATGLSHGGPPRIFGFIAVTLASVNIFGGFLVTQRMLSMFKSKK